MPNREQKNVRSTQYEWLKERDGEFCWICLKKPTWNEPLQIDHVDGNPSNRSPSNLKLLCRSCNLSLRWKSAAEHKEIISYYGAKNERERKRLKTRDEKTVLRDEQFKRLKRILECSSGSVEIKLSSDYQIDFVIWLLDYLVDYKQIPYKEARASGAYITGASTETINRYLEPLISGAGPLKVDRGLITFKFPMMELTTIKDPTRNTNHNHNGNGHNGNGNGNGHGLEHTIPGGIIG